MINEKFGNWTVIQEPFRKPNYSLYCLCRCKCGTERIVDFQSLKRGKTNSCGCQRKTRLIDLTGKKYGMLTVISKHGKSPSGIRWNCVCDCGKRTIATGNPLKSGITKSCGCIKAVRIYGRGNNNATTHGLSYSSSYRTHAGMMDRCYKSTCISFKNYGGRGITVCDRWHNLSSFIEDMGERPNGYSIERIDNDGNYTPENCKWATAKEQANNRRPKKSITYGGVTRTYLAWSLHLGGEGTLVFTRLKRGWSEERAVSTKARDCHKVKH